MPLFENDIKAGRIVRGMNFHEQVWAIVSRIPAGRVTTYGQIAVVLDTPNAARAVGHAMNRNPFAPTVPCHRVVGADGSLTGYAGGLPMKERLLREEGVEVEGRRVDVERFGVSGEVLSSAAQPIGQFG